MSIAHGQVIEAPVAVTIEHRPWWQNRLVVVAAIVGAMVVCYFALSRTLAWPSSLEWSSDQGNADHPNILFRILDGISSGLETLVTWLYDALTKVTWVGATALGTLIGLRFGGLRAGAIMLAAFASFGLFGLWAESNQTLALMLAAVAISTAVGI